MRLVLSPRRNNSRMLRHIQDLANFPPSRHFCGAPASTFKPFRKLPDPYGMLDLHIFHSNAYGIQSSRDAFYPLVALKLFEAQSDGFIKSRSGHFDRVGNSLDVRDRNAA